MGGAKGLIDKSTPLFPGLFCAYDTLGSLQLLFKVGNSENRSEMVVVVVVGRMEGREGGGGWSYVQSL